MMHQQIYDNSTNTRYQVEIIVTRKERLLDLQKQLISYLEQKYDLYSPSGKYYMTPNRLILIVSKQRNLLEESFIKTFGTPIGGITA